MKIKGFLFQSFAQVFFPIFLVLFFIVKISFAELSLLYFYTLPTMLFFVIPLSFFVACVLGLSRLSFDYELPVLFALGLSPHAILKIFIPITLLATLSLLILSLVLTPLSDTAYRQFLEEKKNNININLQTGEFGQKLGEWLVYTQHKTENDIYQNIVLLSISKEEKKKGFIFAKEAFLESEEGVMEAVLRDGSLYRKHDFEMEKILFEKLILRNVVNFKEDAHLGLLEYWGRAFYENERKEKTQRNLCMSILLSFFPLLSLFYVPFLGIKNPRYHKNYTLLEVLSAVLIFAGAMYLSASYFPILGMLLLPVCWGLVGYLLYRHFILRFY